MTPEDRLQSRLCGTCLPCDVVRVTVESRLSDSRFQACTLEVQADRSGTWQLAIEPGVLGAEGVLSVTHTMCHRHPLLLAGELWLRCAAGSRQLPPQPVSLSVSAADASAAADGLQLLAAPRRDALPLDFREELPLLVDWQRPSSSPAEDVLLQIEGRQVCTPGWRRPVSCVSISWWSASDPLRVEEVAAARCIQRAWGRHVAATDHEQSLRAIARVLSDRTPRAAASSSSLLPAGARQQQQRRPGSSAAAAPGRTSDVALRAAADGSQKRLLSASGPGQLTYVRRFSSTQSLVLESL